ncbi:MAG: HEPN domain-containing protein [Bdellovibrionota bacterium]
MFGFLCQQAAEKSLKAALSSRGVVFRKTHDLRELLDLLADNGFSLPENVLAVRELNPFAVEYRYDEWIDGSEPIDRKELLLLVRRCLEWADSIVRAV